MLAMRKRARSMQLLRLAVALLPIVGVIARSSSGPFISSVMMAPRRSSSSSLPSTTRTTMRRSQRMLLDLRGGDSAPPSTTTTDPPPPPPQQRELTLDEKVHAAMKKLGLEPPPEVVVPTIDAAPDNNNIEEDGSCPDGVCAMPATTETTAAAVGDSTATPPPLPPNQPQQQDEDPISIVNRISETMKVDTSMVWAALSATSTAAAPTAEDDSNSADNTPLSQPRRVYHEQAARDMITLELEMIAQIREDSVEVQQLVDEGWGAFMARRALAFAERNVADARAILMADRMDEEEEDAAAALEAEQQQQQAAASSFKTVSVDANFDPTQMAASPAAPSAPSSPPKPAPREEVIFEATTAQVQELVLESPVPVLLDIYADWCGPCKALSPILEDMAIKSGGVLRLVKVNSDNERAIAGALGVTALPTIFGMRDGQILHMFQGMPKSEEMLKNFLMGLLIPGHSFQPPVTAKEQETYNELSTKLMKVAGSAAFSFAARERLQDRVTTLLEDLVTQTGDVYDAEQTAKTVRALLSNCLRHPADPKYRTVNLSNKVVAAKIAQYPAGVAMLKIIGFQPASELDDNGHALMILGKGKRIVNVAPLSVTRDAIDKWIDKTRYEVAKAARKRQDEQDRVQVQKELAVAAAAEDAKAKLEREQGPKVDPNECKLRLRLDGKNKSHDVVMHADDSLRSILDQIPGFSIDGDDDEFQITCVAKKLIVKSTDTEALSRSLRDHGLLPTAALVVKQRKTTSGGGNASHSSSLSERAASRKKKTGSHTMQSTGIYGKDDNAKGELVDGGGGTLYEQDVTDDEEEEEAAASPAEAPSEEAEAFPEADSEESIEEDE